MKVPIYKGEGPIDPWLVRDWLEKNGIDAWVEDPLYTPADFSWPSVWVLEADREAAEGLLVTGEIRGLGPVGVRSVG
jgi:hypothetical protein